MDREKRTKLFLTMLIAIICLYQENAKGDRFHQKSCQLYSLSRKRHKYFIIEIIKIYFLVMLFGVKITITLTDILIF